MAWSGLISSRGRPDLNLNCGEITWFGWVNETTRRCFKRRSPHLGVNSGILFLVTTCGLQCDSEKLYSQEPGRNTASLGEDIALLSETRDTVKGLTMNRSKRISVQ
ncbi:hypothetical protein FIBSPDRAFT_883745 [Athelia psychrophila]|uniref:Uncharacterized protein n=1 Tax=Athelia psychrophila TaxID=1759441 RepID=A0A166TW73_9AGAM|nr:hypothetical protein FIBSPDRAFT_883745 [Fibularhizoctonia sp. CBS 109695]